MIFVFNTHTSIKPTKVVDHRWSVESRVKSVKSPLPVGNASRRSGFLRFLPRSRFGTACGQLGGARAAPTVPRLSYCNR
eukprot:3380085-Prymnesium_polylepis.1